MGVFHYLLGELMKARAKAVAMGLARGVLNVIGKIGVTVSHLIGLIATLGSQAHGPGVNMASSQECGHFQWQLFEKEMAALTRSRN